MTLLSHIITKMSIVSLIYITRKITRQAMLKYCEILISRFALEYRYGVSQDSLHQTLERHAFEEEKTFELEMIENRKEEVSDLRHVKAEQMRWILSSATRFQIEIQSSQIDASEIIRNYTISHFGTERSLLERFSEEQDMMLGYLTSDDEHAVSILMAGPRKSNMKDNLPEATLKAPPVAL